MGSAASSLPGTLDATNPALKGAGDVIERVLEKALKERPCLAEGDHSDIVAHLKNSLLESSSDILSGATIEESQDSKTEEAHPGLKKWWDKSVGELATVPTKEFSEEEKERHRIYSHLCGAILFSQFNHRKYGHGTYNKEYCDDLDETQEFSTYIGHNICCLAVNEKGNILDYQFNHNYIYGSTVEHAEARLLQRLFSIMDIVDHHSVLETKDKQVQNRYKNIKYSKLLKNITLYTSLESCAQCSGIMALARLKDVFFLQPDYGMYAIGNIMHNASPPWLKAPRPHSLNAIGIEDLSTELAEAYQAFEAKMMSGDKGDDTVAPFFVDSDGNKEYSASPTTFLCTAKAREVFKKHETALNDFQLKYADFKLETVADCLSNKEILQEAQDFYHYVKEQGGRGTHNKC